MDAVKSISYIFDDLNKMTFNDSSKETLFIKFIIIIKFMKTNLYLMT